MKKFSVVILSVVLFIAGCARNQSSEEKSTTAFTIDSLQVILRTIPGNPVVAAGFYQKGGTRYVPGDQAGIERFLFETATHGTESLSKDELNASLESMGTNLNIEAQYDYNGLTMTCLRRSFTDSWDIFSDVLLHPSFQEKEIELVREQLLSSIRSEQDEPDSYVQLLSNNLYYQAHPYAVSLFGTESFVSNVSRDALLEYHDTQITKARALMVIVGDLTRDDVQEQVRSLAAGLPAGTSRPDTGDDNGYDAGPPDVTVAERNIPTNYIRGLCPAPTPGSADYPAFASAFRILDNKLFEEIRTKRNLSYAPAAGSSRREDNYGIIYVSTTQPDTTLRVMFRTIEQMADEPLTQKELSDEISQAITRDLMNQETAAAQMDQLVMFEIVGGDWRQAAAYIDRLRELTPQDIREAIGRYAHNFHFGVVGHPDQISETLFTSR